MIALKIQLSDEQTRRFLEAFAVEAIELAKKLGGESNDSRGNEILDRQAGENTERA